MNNLLGVSPSKGNQGTTRGKRKNLLTSVGIEPTTSGLLRGRTEKVGDDSHRGQKSFSLPRVVPLFPLLGLTPSGLFMGLFST